MVYSQQSPDLCGAQPTIRSAAAITPLAQLLRALGKPLLLSLQSPALAKHAGTGQQRQPCIVLTTLTTILQHAVSLRDSGINVATTHSLSVSRSPVRVPQ